MEIFVRLAITKYFKSGLIDSMFESVRKMYDELVLPLFKKYDSHDFRINKLWCEECDNIYKNNLKVISDLYGKYSGKMSLPGQPKFMCLEEFIDLITDSGVVDDTFGAREIGMQFN